MLPNALCFYGEQRVLGLVFKFSEQPDQMVKTMDSRFTSSDTVAVQSGLADFPGLFR